VGADGSGLAVAINQQSEMFNLLLAKLDSVQAKLGEVEQTVATQSQTISYLHDKVDTLQRDKDELTTQIALSPARGGKKRSLGGGGGGSNKKQAMDQLSLDQPMASSSAQASTQPLPSTAVAQAASSSAQASTTVQAPKAQRPVLLSNNSESKMKGSPSDKNQYLSIVLSKCCKAGTLEYGRPWTYEYSTNDWAEVQSLKNTIELVWLVATKDEKKLLRDKKTDKAKLNDVTCDIEKRAFKKMYELEGKNPDKEMKKNEQNAYLHSLVNFTEYQKLITNVRF